jgi:uncharacterized protein (TIGR02996 family)
LTTDFDALWAAVLDRPLDAAPRLVLADWLADRGADAALEVALRSRALPFIEARATRFGQTTRGKSKRILKALRTYGTKLSEKPMSLTYSDGATYKGKITKWGIAESSKKKTPQVFFTVSILAELDDKGEEFDCPSYERTIYRAVTENTVDFLIDDIGRLGFELTSFSQLNPDDPNAIDFTDKEVVVRCKHEEYEGKARERFDFNFARQVEQLDKAGVSKLDQLFGSRLKKGGAGKAKPAAKEKPAPAGKTVEEEFNEIM